MSTGAEAVARTPAEDDLWFDEIVERSDDWVVVRVTTPEGKRVLYRIMIKPLPAGA